MQFRYEATNAGGTPVEGTISASDRHEAFRLLRQQELVPTALSAADAAGRRKLRRKTSAQDRAIVLRELATLLQSGLPLADAVSSLASARSRDALGGALERVHAQLRTGEPLSRGLQASGESWPEYVIQFASAGEETGQLGQALDSAASQMEYEQRVREDMRSALTYPTVLVVSGIAAVLLVFIVVVPKFSSLLKASKGDLPWISDVVLRVGLAVRDNLLWVGLLAVIAGAAAVSALSRASVRQRLLGWLGRVPVLGEWLRETEVGRWASMMSSLLGSRVPILRAMELSSRGVALAGLRAHLEHAIRGVRGGKSLADAVSGSVWVDDTAVNLIRTGEASGQLPLMLQTLAKLREARAKERLRRFLILLEPAAILVIGGIIGTVMIAIMLAITSLSNIAL